MKINHEGEFEHDEFEPEEIDVVEPLRIMLAPYVPTTNELDADKLYSTSEIVFHLEQHYGISQSDPDTNYFPGPKVVGAMHELGYKASNVGGLGMCWLLKKKYF